MCYEKRDPEIARICQERDELKRICERQAEMNGKLAAMALELDEVKAERDALMQVVKKVQPENVDWR